MMRFWCELTRDSRVVVAVVVFGLHNYTKKAFPDCFNVKWRPWTWVSTPQITNLASADLFAMTKPDFQSLISNWVQVSPPKRGGTSPDPREQRKSSLTWIKVFVPDTTLKFAMVDMQRLDPKVSFMWDNQLDSYWVSVWSYHNLSCLFQLVCFAIFP